MFKGSMPALITPFKNGKVDVDALKHLVIGMLLKVVMDLYQ